MYADSFDDITCANLTFFQHSKVESGPPTFQQVIVKALHTHLDRQLVARHSRLGHFEDRCPYSESVAHMNLVIEHLLDGEVLAELPKCEICSMKLTCPEGIVLEGINQDRSDLATMVDEVGLAISLDIQGLDLYPPTNRFLEDAGANSLAFDSDLAWKGDVNR